MKTVELLNGTVEPFERLIALAQQVLEPGFGGLQMGVQRGFPPIAPATVLVRIHRTEGSRPCTRERAGPVDVLRSDVRMVVSAGLKDGQNDVVIPLKAHHLT